MSNHYSLGIIGVVLCLVLTSCGYTTKTLLPEHIQTVYVERVENQINITDEVSSTRAFKVYRPGLEVELRNAAIERFIFDGHLRIGDRDTADAILRLYLIEFNRDPLRFNPDESIQEFRVNVVASAEFVDLAENKTLWSTGSISGDSDYFTSGENAKSEDQAVQEALEDLARHLVENILEVW